MLLDMGEGLSSVAEATAKLAVHHYRQRRRVRRGSTVRPGARTPLWNELAAEARRLIRKRGEKVNLSRFLGFPRQRVHEFLKAQSAVPDGERTLMLLTWVSAKRRGAPVELNGVCHVLRDNPSPRVSGDHAR